MKQKMKILVGFDGSPYSLQAMEDLKRSGLPQRADCMVLSAADVFLPGGPKVKIPKELENSVKLARQSAMKKIDMARKLAEEGRDKIKKIMPGWTVVSQHSAASPAWGLLNKAESWKADLVVVGAHGHTNVGRFLGSVSQMVLTQASCSVRVGRIQDNASIGKRRILIGLDGSPDSDAAIEAACRRANGPGVEYLLVSVIDPIKSTFLDRFTPSVIRWFLEKGGDERVVLGRMLEFHAKKLRKKGSVVSCKVVEGDPKRLLLEEAETWGAETIFVGARGLTHLKRFFMGGVSMAVSARAHCSVEVVRPV